MNLEEWAAKPFLAEAGIPVPASALATTPAGAREAAETIGPCVVKAQVPTGKRGKAGGIKLASTPAEAEAHAEAILALTIADWPVEKLLIEAQAPIEQELYAAVINDAASQGPMVLFSTQGGMDVEELAESDPTAMRRHPVSITQGFSTDDAKKLVQGAGLGAHQDKVAEVLTRLYTVYRQVDAELLEINPLVLTKTGEVMALDCKLTVDDAAAFRQEKAASLAAPEKRTDLEAKAEAAGLKYIELGGDVGVLANGAGLTMTTMDAITHYGGAPTNFLEIGGEAYTKGEIALEILLGNPRIKSLLVNFCGAFARTDVMAEGVVEAWQKLNPDIPVFFTIHGTGEERAKEIVKDRLGMEPFELMDDAVKAAVAAAKSA